MDFHEKLSVSLHLSNLVLLENSRSENYKSIRLFSHNELGKILILDGEIQHIEAWTSIYHETLVHLPVSFLKEVETVLILGGGCFFTAKEVLKYKSVKKVIMIDIDNEVVSMIKKHYSHANEILQDKRFSLIIDDAFTVINHLENKFDLVINDSIDLLSIRGSRSPTIFTSLVDLTTPSGLCVDMIYRHIFEKRTIQTTVQNLRRTGLNCVYSLMSIPEYPGVLHVLMIWGRSRKLSQGLKRTRNIIQKNWLLNSRSQPYLYFNPNCLNYYLYLPPYLKEIIDESPYLQ